MNNSLAALAKNARKGGESRAKAAERASGKYAEKLSTVSEQTQGNPAQREKRATKRPQESGLPEGWAPGPVHVQLAKDSDVDLDKELNKFKDYHGAKGSRFRDWDAAFRNWLRNAADYKPRSQQKPVTTVSTQLKRIKDLEAAENASKMPSLFDFSSGPPQ